MYNKSIKVLNHIERITPFTIVKLFSTLGAHEEALVPRLGFMQSSPEILDYQSTESASLLKIQYTRTAYYMVRKIYRRVFSLWLGINTEKTQYITRGSGGRHDIITSAGIRQKTTKCKYFGVQIINSGKDGDGIRKQREEKQ